MIEPSLIQGVQEQQQGVTFRIGTVTGRADDWYFVQDTAISRLKRATSCLVEPQLGDLVLICHLGTGRISYINAVLQTTVTDSARIQLPGNVTLTTSADRLVIDANAITLNGTESLQLTTSHMQMTAAAASLRVSHLRSWSETIETHATKATLAVATLISQIGTAISRLRDSIRKVDGLDEVHADRSRLLVTGQHKVEAEHVSVNAKGYVRIDGKKIDLG